MEHMNDIEIHVKDKRIREVKLNGKRLDFVKSVTVQYDAESLTEVTLVLNALDSDVKVVLDDDNSCV